MEGFFKILDEKTLYMSFREDDEQQQHRRMMLNQKTFNAGSNIQTAIKYILYKWIALTVLAAIAELTGGDVPLHVFKTDFIPDHDLFRLLHEGRAEECKFDVKNSPLATYLYLNLSTFTKGWRALPAG